MSRRCRIALSAVAIFACMIVLCLNPSRYARAFLSGISVWGSAILPAAFPYLVLSTLLLKTGAMQGIAKALAPSTRFLWNTGGMGGYVFLMSLICGYPVGAKTLSELVAIGAISHREAGRVSSYSSTASPSFLLGSVASILGSSKSASIIFFCHILGAILNGILYRGRGRDEPFPLPTPQATLTQNIIWSGVQTVLLIGGYVAIFFVAVEALSALGILAPVIRLAEGLATAVGLPAGLGAGLVRGLCEVTNGISCLSSLYPVAPRSVTVAACFLVSVGGGCVGLQNLSFLRQAGVKGSRYVLQKCTQAILSTLLCAVAVLVFLP